MKNIFSFLLWVGIFIVMCPTIIFSEVESVPVRIPVLRKEIFEAAKNGDTHVFVELIKESANFYMEDEDGNTLFHVAAEHGHSDIVELLADYDNKPDGFLSQVRHFLYGQRKPDINAKNKVGKTALHSSVDNDDLESLLMVVWKGGDTDVCDNNGQTPLLYAAEKGKKDHTLYLMNVCDNYYSHTTPAKETILHRALAHNYQDLAKEIIAFNEEICAYDREMAGDNFLIKAKNNNEETVLLYSARTYNQEILKLLLTSNSQDVQSIVNEPDKTNRTPFVHICYQKNADEIEDLFLRYQPDLNRKTSIGLMPLYIVLSHVDHARDFTRVEKLIRHGADINAQDVYCGDTILHRATDAHKCTAIEWLLKHNANVNIRNKAGQDSMDVAIKKGYERLLPLFIAHGGDVDRLGEKGQTRLMIEMSRGNNEMVARLIDLKANIFLVDNNGQNVLHKAAASTNKRGSEIILKRNKNVINYQDKDGNTPLHFAADSKTTADLVGLYLLYGASVDTHNVKGEAPIHRAAAAGNAASINFLKNNKSSLVTLTKESNSPAHYVLINDRFDCLSLLLDKRIVNTVNQDGKTIMSLAIEKGLSKRMLQEIIEHGVDLQLRPNKNTGDTYLHCAIKFDNSDALKCMMIPTLINQRNTSFTSPLSCAVQKKNHYAVQQLLQNGAFVNIPDNNGWTEAHYAAVVEGGRLLEMLYDYGSLYEKRTNDGSTCLHIAARYNNVKNIQSLKARDINLDREDDNGNIAFEIAVKNGHVAATKALLCEKYFINGKAQEALRTLQSLFFKSSVQMYLEQELNKRNSDCNKLVEMQNQLTTLIKTNQISSSLLHQKAIKDNACFSYPYNNIHKDVVFYSLDFFKKSYQSDRNVHYAYLRKAIDHELTESKELKQRLASIDAKNAQKQLEEKQQVTRQEETVSKESEESSDGSEAECTMCAESKKDAQRRCANSKCSAMLCNDCVNSYMKGKSACLYCFNALEK